MYKLVQSITVRPESRYSEHEKESKQGTDEIKKLKEELQELKTRSAIETSYLSGMRYSSATAEMDPVQQLHYPENIFNLEQ